MKKIVSLLFALTIFVLASAQLHPPHFMLFPPNTGCGVTGASPTVSLVSVSPACYRSSDTIQLKSSTLVDSIYVTFGDGTDTTLANLPSATFNIIHKYNFSPYDSCPPQFIEGEPALVCNLSATWYMKCAGGYYLAPNSTGIAFRFKPRVRFAVGDYSANYIPGQLYLVPCNTTCFQVNLSNCCTNTYWNTDSTSYTWSFGDGSPDLIVYKDSSSSYQDPQICYAHAPPAPGYYTLKLAAYNTCGGDSDWFKVYVEQIDSIQLPSGPYCTGTPIHLHIDATGGMGTPGYNIAISPAGTPPDTVSVTGANTSSPVIVFNQSGIETITAYYGACYTVITDTVNQGVDMSQSPVPNVCYTGNNQLLLTDYFFSSAVAQSNHFVIRDSASVIYNNTSNTIPATPVALTHYGVYYISDTSITTCNTVTFRDTFNVLPLAVFNFPADTSLCLQTTYNLPSVPGTIITLDADTVLPGPFYVDSIREYDFIYTPTLCGNKDTLKITGKGIKAYAPNITLCSMPGIIPLSGTPPGGSFSGNFVSNSQFNGNSAGLNNTYYYKITDAATTCIYTDTSFIFIYPQFQSSFSLTLTACADSSITFTNSNNSQTSDVFWGDGTSDTGNIQLHNYSQPGIWRDTILITDSLGCTNKAFDSVVVLPPPNARFTITVDTVCDNTLVKLIAADTTSLQNTYLWTLGADTFSRQPQASIDLRDTSNAIIIQTITLTVTSPSCGTLSQSLPVTVLPKTVADFGQVYHSNCSPLQDTFVNNSRGYQLSYQWYKDNVLISTDATPAPQSLSATGADSTYTFTLIVCSSACGCDTMTNDVVVHPVNFGICLSPEHFTICQGQPLIFSDSCTASDCSLLYDFGDGSTYATNGGGVTSHIFTQADTFTVRLKAICECNVDSTQQSIVVIPAPSVDSHVSNPACISDTTYFSSQTISGNPFAYWWSFGDGGIDSLHSNPIHIYQNPGAFNGWLVAVGSNGCPSDTSRFNITVFPVPDVSYTGDTAVCQFAKLYIKTDSLAPNSTYIWSITGPRDTEQVTTSTGAFLMNTSDTGTFDLTLKAYTNAAPLCAATSATTQVVVMESPVANFTILPVRSPILSNVSFLNQSIHALSYWWNFGNADLVNVYEENPVYQYTTPGLYQVTLTAINNLCRDTIQKSIIIDPVPDLFIPNTITANGDGNNDFFQIYGHLDAIINFEVKIFDRTGELVFESNDAYFKWDATYKGKLVGPAVFVYEMHMGFLGGTPGEVRKTKGSITVLR